MKGCTAASLAHSSVGCAQGRCGDSRCLTGKLAYLTNVAIWTGACGASGITHTGDTTLIPPQDFKSLQECNFHLGNTTEILGYSGCEEASV